MSVIFGKFNFCNDGLVTRFFGFVQSEKVCMKSVKGDSCALWPLVPSRDRGNTIISGFRPHLKEFLLKLIM